MKDFTEEIDIDFDFETGEVVEVPEMDRVDFRARIPTLAGPATICHWVKVPHGIKDKYVHIKYGDRASFIAELLLATRRRITGPLSTTTPYSYAGLIE